MSTHSAMPDPHFESAAVAAVCTPFEEQARALLLALLTASHLAESLAEALSGHDCSKVRDGHGDCYLCELDEQAREAVVFLWPTASMLDGMLGCSGAVADLAESTGDVLRRLVAEEEPAELPPAPDVVTSNDD